MQPLVPLIFHNLPSLYPPSFRRNVFLYLYNNDLQDHGTEITYLHNSLQRSDRWLVVQPRMRGVKCVYYTMYSMGLCTVGLCIHTLLVEMYVLLFTHHHDLVYCLFLCTLCFVCVFYR